MTATAGIARTNIQDDGTSELFDRLGTGRDVTGTMPFMLSRPDVATFVAAGMIDVFIVECTDGQPSGSRDYFCSFGPGDLLFGFDQVAGTLGAGFLAVGTVGTRVVDLPVGALRAPEVALRHSAALAAQIDRWVVALSASMSEVLAPSPFIDVVVPFGGSTRAAANQRISVQAGVGWITSDAGGSLFLDSQEAPSLDRGDPFPLCPGTWLMFGQPARVECHNTTGLVRDGRVWAGLRGLHDAILEEAPLGKRLGAADEANRLRRRAAQDEAELSIGLGRLQAIIAAEPISDGAPPGSDALFAACSSVAARLGVTLQAGPQGGREAPQGLDEILNRNHLRKRLLRLESRWWRKDVGSFLLVGERPSAVVRVRSGYMLVDGATGGTRPLTGRDAAELNGTPYALYAPLPAGPLTARAIGSLALAWGASELRVIAGYGLVGGVLALAGPIAVSYLVDTIIPDGDRAGLAELAAILLVVALTQFAVALTVQRGVLRLEGRVGSRLQAAILDRLLRLPPRFFRLYSVGELTARALAVQRIEAALTGAVVTSLLGGVFAIISFGLMLYYSTVLGAVAIGLALVFAAVTVAFCVARVRYERGIVQMRGTLAGELLEVTTGIAKLRLAAAENRAFGRWAARFSELQRRTAAAARLLLVDGVVGAGFALLAQGIVFGTVVYSGLLKGGLGLGALMAFLAAFGQGLAGISQLSQVALTLVALRPMLQHAQPILDAVPETTTGRVAPGTLTGGIDVSHVSFRYEAGAAPIFQDLSLRIEPGEYVALVGPSGCGKSTLVRLLLGFEAPESGLILFDGKDQAGLDIGAVRRQMGVVLQTSRLIGTSLLDNILGAHVSAGEDEAWRAAELAGLDDDIRAMPMGMQTVVNDATLSGGQLQRVAIARALIHDPRIVVLDEATSALDNRTQAIVVESLLRIRATRIVVAHRLSTIMAADRIVVLDGGRVAESGSYAELVKRNGLFSRLAARQVVTADPNEALPTARGGSSDRLSVSESRVA